jgi:NADH-quinone oxidoreductase subunit G
VPTIYIDGRPYEVDGDDNLLQQCLTLGFDLPYFCWHPALGSVGSCRQCAVTQYKDEKDSKGHVVMACMTEIKDGMRISLQDQEASTFRSRVIEWLMTSHPHDCPVCDEGGECHLQDMTVMTGHTYRRYRFNKRTFNNQDLGPFINHEMNRCITCYRCVRFYDDYAGGKDLQAFASRNHVYFGRHQEGPLDNAFSGNLVEVCPTGVFTDKTLKKHYTRKWDLQSAPSVCMHCGAGCNIIAGERYGSVRRILNRYNSEVNGYFICDRGRFGYEFVNSEQRIKTPRIAENDDRRQSLSVPEVLDKLAETFSTSQRIIGIGSPRASLESNYALRALVGEDQFYAGLAADEHKVLENIIHVLQHGSVPTPTLSETEQADAVLVLGEDIGNTAPRMALACRQAVRQKQWACADELGIPRWMDGLVRDAGKYYLSPLFVATPGQTSLDDVATTHRLAPADIARLGFAIAHALDPKAPAVKGLDAPLRDTANTIAKVMQAADRPLIVSGCGCVDVHIVQAAANVAKALSHNNNARLYYAVPESNSTGLALLNARPLHEAFAAVKQSESPVTAVILENDLYRRAPAAEVDAFVNNVERLVVMDHTTNTTTGRADVCLPVATFAETTGTVVSAEGRMQRFFAAMQPVNERIFAAWQWTARLFSIFRQQHPPWQRLEEVMTHCADELPELRHIINTAPLAGQRFTGLSIPRSPYRYSGRTAMHAHYSIHEPRMPKDTDSSLAYSMEGLPGQPPASLVPFYWSPGWNSVQASNKYQLEVGGPLRGGDPGVRVFEHDNIMSEYFSRIPAAFKRKGEGHWLFVPIHHVFGSEELSAQSPAVAQRVPQPYVAINYQDAEAMGVDDGDHLEVCVHDSIFHLPCQTTMDIAAGIAGLPGGLPGLSGILPPLWGRMQCTAMRDTRYGSG